MDTSTLPQTQIVIVNYEKFSQKSTPELLKEIRKRKFDCIVLDEAHRIKSRTAQVSKNIMTLKYIPRRLLVTGTPAPNKPYEVFNLLKFLHPATHTSYWKWVDKYFNTYNVAYKQGNEIGGWKPGMRKQFQQELDTYCINRKLRDVVDWDTTVDVIDIPLPVPPSLNKAISQLKEEYIVGNIEAIGLLDQASYMKQLCNIPKLIGVNAPSPKLAWLTDFIKQNKDDRIVLFSMSRKTLEELHTIFCGKISCGLITGKIAPRQRQEIVSNFQKGTIQLLLCQTQACKEGLTLDRGDVEIFFDSCQSSVDYLQAQKRIVSTVADNARVKRCYRLMLSKQYDEYLYNLVDNNTVRTDVINSYKSYLGGM